jgi:hypothetical protein
MTALEIRRRIGALSDEIRHYPTPIARCDEQLTALIEERAGLLARLEENQNSPGGCTVESIWINEGGFHAA